MSNNIKYLFFFTSFIVIIGVFEIIYLSQKKIDLDTKIKTVKLLSMPDLAVCNEAFYIRHRSLASVADSFSVSPSLLAYFPSDFVYSPGIKR